MKKYKVNFSINRKSRVEDDKNGERFFEAENLFKAVEKIKTFVHAFYGPNIQIIKLNIEEI